jgi:alkylation response protein AidB-like acyl-CoA dehydrogenase
VGIAQRCLEISVAHASSRVQFGQPIGKHQAIAFKIADMAARVEASRLLVRNAASIKQAGGKVTKYSSMAKLFASDTAMDSAIEAVQILGSSGLVAGSVAEQLFRDAKLTQIYEGTNEIQRIVISRALME